jgi:aminoglycoside 3'-phosphotransferase-1
MDTTALPAALRGQVAGLDWHRDTVGESGCAIWALGPRERPSLFLKHAEGCFVADLDAEHARLAWLAGRWPVPEIRGYERGNDEAWLLTGALSGQMAEALFEDDARDRVALSESMGRFLRGLHDLGADDCPFDSGLVARLSAARRNIDLGLVDEDDFDEEREGWSAEQVWRELDALLPIESEPVVTHGDFSLGNVMVENGAVVGCLDVGRAGPADRYQDLAILWNCLRGHGEAVTAAMWRGYGIAQPDHARLQVHLLLDELF